MDEVEAMDLVSGAAPDCPCLTVKDSDCVIAGCYHITGEGACLNCDSSGVKVATQIRIAYVEGLKRAKEYLADRESYSASVIQSEIDRALSIETE